MGLSVRQKILEWREPVQKKFGPDILCGSVLNYQNGLMDLVYFLEQEPVGGTIVETGTLFGLSTAILAQYADYVVTVDLATPKVPGRPRPPFEPYNTMQPRELARHVWRFLGVDDKITTRTTMKGAVPPLDDVSFRLAYIDGDHGFGAVQKDFEAVARCGNVVFHDYANKSCGGVRQFVDTLTPPAHIRGTVAFWKGDDSHGCISKTEDSGQIQT